MKNVFRLMPLVAVLAAAGCTSVDQMPFQSKVDYRSGSDNLSTNTLEVPPDLSAPTTTNSFVVPGKTLAGTTPAKAPAATAASVAATSTTTPAAATTDEAAISKATTLPANQSARLVQAGSQRWLVVQGDPAKLWPEIRQFWLDNGFLLTSDNPSIGIMETDWQENRANLPQDIVTRMLRKIADGVISTGLLDRFRTRVEQGTEPGTVEIFLTHQGMKEVYKDNGSDSPRNAGTAGGDANVQTVWTPRPEDPELEAQMLALMLQKFGMPTQQAQQVVATPVKVPDGATLTDNNTSLSVNDTYDRAWRRVGLALDRTGYVVFDRNRSEGVYYVKQAEADIGKEQTSDSFMSKLAFWNKKQPDSVAKQSEFQVVLKQELNTIKVTVTGKDGHAADGKVAYDILSKLQTQLK